MFEVTQSHNRMPCLEIENASPELHAFLRALVGSQWTESIEYQISKPAGAFFQSGFHNKEGFVLIEFWNPKGAEAFVDYVNANAPI